MAEKKKELADIAYEFLEEAIKQFYAKDKILLEQTRNGKEVPIKGTERSCVFRIGIYFQKELDKYPDFSLYSLDLEYSKQGINNPKKLGDGNVIPDMILHRRTEKDNLLVVEFKGYWRRNSGSDRDRDKLEKYTKLDGELRYKIGAFVELGKDTPNYKKFIDGKAI